MIVKKTKQLENFERGINLYVPTRRRDSAAPAGIPVATTNNIIVSNSSLVDGSYFKQSSTSYIGAGFSKSLIWEYEVPNRWTLINFVSRFTAVHPTWSDQTQIPASGWPNGETIAAA
jgi:hypothetical protein